MRGCLTKKIKTQAGIVKKDGGGQVGTHFFAPSPQLTSNHESGLIKKKKPHESGIFGFSSISRERKTWEGKK